MREDIYGDYPFILYRHFFIARGNIAKFCKMMTGINNVDRLKISREERDKIEHLEILLQHRLHTVTVTLNNADCSIEIELPLGRASRIAHITAVQPLEPSLLALEPTRPLPLQALRLGSLGPGRGHSEVRCCP